MKEPPKLTDEQRAALDWPDSDTDGHPFYSGSAVDAALARLDFLEAQQPELAELRAVVHDGRLDHETLLRLEYERGRRDGPEATMACISARTVELTSGALCSLIPLAGGVGHQSLPGPVIDE